VAKESHVFGGRVAESYKFNAGEKARNSDLYSETIRTKVQNVSTALQYDEADRTIAAQSLSHLVSGCAPGAPSSSLV
jgi:hypothetical protein